MGAHRVGDCPAQVRLSPGQQVAQQLRRHLLRCQRAASRRALQPQAAAAAAAAIIAAAVAAVLGVCALVVSR